MIISTILESIMDLLDTVFYNFVIAPVQSVNDLLSYFAFIVGQGFGLFQFIFPPASRAVMIVLLSAHAVLLIYYIIMWIIKKIPLLNIHD